MDVLLSELYKLLAPYVLWIAALFAASEILAAIPSIAANSVFQIVRQVLSGILEGIKNALGTKPTPTAPTK